MCIQGVYLCCEHRIKIGHTDMDSDTLYLALRVVMAVSRVCWGLVPGSTARCPLNAVFRTSNLQG